MSVKAPVRPLAQDEKKKQKRLEGSFKHWLFVDNWTVFALGMEHTSGESLILLISSLTLSNQVLSPPGQ